jgi:hypothetical protein
MSAEVDPAACGGAESGLGFPSGMQCRKNVDLPTPDAPTTATTGSGTSAFITNKRKIK